MIDRVAADLGRTLLEVPVGFKWFVPGLLDGSVAFGGEESAGASFLQRDGSVWTTDKDGIILCLLGLGDHRGRPGSRRRSTTRSLTARYGDAGLRADRLAGHPRAEGGAGQALAGAGHGRRAGRRADHRDADHGARQRRGDRWAQGDRPSPAGSPPGRRAPRTSTSSTPSRSAAPSTWPDPGRGPRDRRRRRSAVHEQGRLRGSPHRLHSIFTEVTRPATGLRPWILPGGTGLPAARRAGAGLACRPAVPWPACPGRWSPCLTSLPRYRRTRTARAGVSGVCRFPHAAGDGHVSTRRPPREGVGAITALRGTAAPPGI